MKFRHRHRWITRIVLGLTVASIAAPLAQASDTVSGDVGSAGTRITIPEGWNDAQFGPASFVTTPQIKIPDGWGDAQFGPANIVVPTAAAAPVETDGFDYGDAGIGLVVGLGAALLGVAGVLVARRHAPLAH
jgi:hypothetical protein